MGTQEHQTETSTFGMVRGAKALLEGCFLVTLPCPAQILNGARAAVSLIPLHFGAGNTRHTVPWTETWLSPAKPTAVSNRQENGSKPHGIDRYRTGPGGTVCSKTLLCLVETISS